MHTVQVRIPVATLLGRERERKGSGIYLPLESTSATVESMVSKEWLQKYSLQFTDPNLPLLLLAQ